MKEMIWNNHKETQQWVHGFLKELSRPCVVLLSGDLGAGKTQIAKWFLEGMGVTTASSPTFAIHQQYETLQGLVDHVDLYRMESDVDLESSGFWDLFLNPQGLVFVEWADRLPESVWPKDWKKISLAIKIESESVRRASLAVTSSGTKPRSAV